MSTVSSEIRIRDRADSLRISGAIVIGLLAFAALGVGWVLATETTCDFGPYLENEISSVPACTEETDAAVWIGTSIGYFLPGLILLYPLYFGLGTLLEGVADLLAEVDRDLDDADDA